jgi:hypothetical protein
MLVINIPRTRRQRRIVGQVKGSLPDPMSHPDYDTNSNRFSTLALAQFKALLGRRRKMFVNFLLSLVFMAVVGVVFMPFFPPSNE